MNCLSWRLLQMTGQRLKKLSLTISEKNYFRLLKASVIRQLLNLLRHWRHPRKVKPGEPLN